MVAGWTLGSLGTQDRTIYLFDAETHSTRILRDERPGFRSAFSGDSQRLVSGDSSGYLSPWRGLGELLHQWQGHPRRISDVAIHPRTEQIIMYDDGTLRVGQQDPGPTHYILAETQDIRLSPSGNLLAADILPESGCGLLEIGALCRWVRPLLVEAESAFIPMTRLVSGTADGGLFLWSTTDGARIRTMGSAHLEYAGDLSPQPTRTRGTYEDDPNDPWGIRRGDGKTPIRSTLDALPLSK